MSLDPISKTDLQSIIREINASNEGNVKTFAERYPDAWAFADAVIELWRTRYPDGRDIDEDDVFEAATELYRQN